MPAVVFCVAEFFHEFGGGVAEVEGYGFVGKVEGIFAGTGVGVVGCAGFFGGGEVGCSVGEVDGTFGVADDFTGAEDCVGNDEGCGLGHADVFGGEDDHAAGDEFGVLPSFDHAG